MSQHYPFFPFAFLLFFTQVLSAQNFPAEMRLSDDGHQLVIGGQAPQGLYDESIIRTINLDFPQTNWWTLLTQNYQAHTDIPAKLTVDGQVWDTVGVRFKGMTSYSQSGNTQKKSFNISLEYLPDNPKLMGYKTFNLNNAFQDPSFLREVFYLHQIRHHIPAAKATYVQLYLNGESWGVYPFVQQLNGDYLQEWFMSKDGTNWRADRPAGGGGGPGGGGWGDGTAALNYLGSDTTQYQKYYTLKSANKDNPWQDLINTCDVLNNTPLDQLGTEITDYLDIDRTLWFLASEIAFTDDDGYCYKGKMDYYLYFEPETGRIVPLEYDGNSAMETQFAQSWSPFYNANKANYPLLNRLLAVPALRQRYLAHMRTIVNELIDPANTNPMIDVFAAHIDSLVQADTKKIYSYNQFVSGVTELKTFITQRRTFLQNNSEMSQVAPQISAVAHFFNDEQWAQPESGQDVWVQATVASATGIDHVYAYYAAGLVGNFAKTDMLDDGLHHDGAAADGVFGASLPGQTSGTWVRWYVEAAAANAAKSVSFLPVGAEHDVFVYLVQPGQTAAKTVVINEIMASNTNTAKDEAGEHDDWIELYNNTTQAIDLGSFTLTDNPVNLDKWIIPAGTILPPDGYLILWADEDSAQGAFHCNFKLSASGEHLLLLNPNGQIADEVEFGAQEPDKGFARIPNGTGDFVIQDPTFGLNNEQASGTAEQTGTEDGLFIRPNPVRELLLVSGLSGKAANGRYTVFNAFGRRMLEQYIDGATSETTLNVHVLPAGMYVLTIRAENGAVQSARFVKAE